MRAFDSGRPDKPLSKNAEKINFIWKLNDGWKFDFIDNHTAIYVKFVSRGDKRTVMVCINVEENLYIHLHV